jgi:hypothetical protein
MGLESDLGKEIDKWTGRIEKATKSVKLRDKYQKDPSKQRLLENIHAYIKDSRHFAEKGDPIRSFEAIIWAWAWLEILKELGVLEINHSIMQQ